MLTAGTQRQGSAILTNPQEQVGNIELPCSIVLAADTTWGCLSDSAFVFMLASIIQSIYWGIHIFTVQNVPEVSRKTEVVHM